MKNNKDGWIPCEARLKRKGLFNLKENYWGEDPIQIYTIRNSRGKRNTSLIYRRPQNDQEVGLK